MPALMHACVLSPGVDRRVERLRNLCMLYRMRRTCIFALLTIGISHVQCARIIDKHNSLLSRQPGASSFGDAIGKALNKKLSQEFGPGWKSYVVPSNDTKQTKYREYLRANNFTSSGIKIPKDVKKQVCTTSSADTYTECKTPKPRILSRCNKETNSEFSTFGAKSRNVHQSKSSIATAEVPKLKGVKEKCSHVKDLVANSNCVSNMLRAPSHEGDIMSIAENEAIGYKISKDGIDSEFSNRIKSDSQQQFQEINKRIKTTNPWEIKIFYNYESDDNSTKMETSEDGK